jgi:hypothetical protein
MNTKSSFDCSFDEQHSRPQRFTYGAAPYATCTLMNGNQEVFHLSHVDKVLLQSSTILTKVGTKVKSKAKIAHINAFNFLVENLESNLQHLCCDQSADGHSDAELVLRNNWYSQRSKCYIRKTKYTSVLNCY